MTTYQEARAKGHTGKNRLSTFEAELIERALDCEKHKLLQTGSFDRLQKQFWDFITEHKREDRREAAKRARVA